MTNNNNRWIMYSSSSLLCTRGWSLLLSRPLRVSPDNLHYVLIKLFTTDSPGLQQRSSGPVSDSSSWRVLVANPCSSLLFGQIEAHPLLFLLLKEWNMFAVVGAVYPCVQLLIVIPDDASSSPPRTVTRVHIVA